MPIHNSMKTVKDSGFDYLLPISVLAPRHSLHTSYSNILPVNAFVLIASRHGHVYEP